jgi:small-conductance mechanosensitive channel
LSSSTGFLGLWRSYIQAGINLYTLAAAHIQRGRAWLVGSLAAVEALQRTCTRPQQEDKATEKEMKTLRAALEEVALLAADIDGLQEKHRQLGDELQAVEALGDRIH